MKEYPNWKYNQTILSLFDFQVGQNPDTIALCSERGALSYQVLDQKSDQLANQLQDFEIGPESIVGICLDRSLEMMLAVLAVLKAGAAYLALDPSYPQRRLQYMLDDSGCELLLTQKKWIVDFISDEIDLFCLDDLSLHQFLNDSLSKKHAYQDREDQELVGNSLNIDSENPAYVVYTSGSTGKPKGVVIPHRSLKHLIEWQIQQSRFIQGMRCLQFASLSFDVSAQEIFSTWCSGGTLVLISEEVRCDHFALWRLILEESIQRFFLPFVMLEQLCQTLVADPSIDPTFLCDILVAGEQLKITPSILKAFTRMPQCVLHNHYGPSETHVVTHFQLGTFSHYWFEIAPIGSAVSQTSLYILNSQLKRVKAGELGELYISGKALGRGYLGKADLTAERFLPNPFAKRLGTRMYRTGDFASMLGNGNLQYHGRADDQIKIRGHRIELGEIEVMLANHKWIQECVVLFLNKGVGNQHMIAYLVSNNTEKKDQYKGNEDRFRNEDEDRFRNEDEDRFGKENESRFGEEDEGRDKEGNEVRGRDKKEKTQRLKEYLQEMLPSVMIPSHFQWIEELPLLPNGKVDRQALFASQEFNTVLQKDGDHVLTNAVQTETEKRLLILWQKLFQEQGLGVQDHFFELGGDSLLTSQLIAKIRIEFTLDISVQDLIDCPSIQELSLVLDQKKKKLNISIQDLPECLISLQRVGENPPLFFIHPVLGVVFPYYELSTLLGKEQPIYGIQSIGILEKQKNFTRVEDMAKYYIQVLKTVQPEGPYFIGGWSFGGPLAFEVAQQLEKRGEKIALLALIDSPLFSLTQWKDLFQIVKFFGSSILKSLVFSLGAYIWDYFYLQKEKKRGTGFWKKARIAQLATNPGSLEKLKTPDLWRFLKITMINFWAELKYTPHVYPGQLTLFCTGKEKRAWGWEDLAQGGVEIHQVPGDHLNLLRSPYVQVLAQEMKKSLQKAQE